MMLTHVIAKTFVFNEQGKLLLLRRSASDNHRPGGLDLPGGKVDDREDVATGAAREALEEAGLALRPEDLQWVYADTVATHNTDIQGDVNMIRITFATKVDKPNVKLSHEHDSYSWHTLEESLKLLKGMRYHEVLVHMMDHAIAIDLWKVI